MEFSTGVVKINDRREGIYSTERFISASGELVDGRDIVVGTKLKTFHIPGIDDTITYNLYSGWFHNGNTLPSGSRITTASAVMGAYYREVIDRIVYEIKPTDSDQPFYLGEYTSILTYNSSSNGFGYTPVSIIDPDDDYLFDASSSLVDIDYANVLVLNTGSGFFFTTDTEPTDHILINTSGSSDVPIAFTFHNK
jgi:hypothetical protein